MNQHAVRWKAAMSLGATFTALAAHRLRTTLTVSALAVSVATVIVMASVAGGAERRIVERVQAAGADLIIVSSAPAPGVAGRARQNQTLTLLRKDDADAIREWSPRVRAVAPSVTQSVVARVGGRNTTVAVTGTTPEGLQIRRIQPSSGRVFDDLEDYEARRVAILGQTVARNLFGDMNPLGAEIRLGRLALEVIGVMNRRGTDVGGTDLDNAVFIPLSTALRRLLNIPYVHNVYVQAARGSQLNALELDVRTALERRHPLRSGMSDPFVVQNQAVLLRTERGTLRALRRVVTGVAFFSLLVGGVGVVAVMLLSLKERVREIGVRRAVGAKRRDVRMQFLLESMILSLLGCATGLLVSAAVTIVASLGPWQLAFPWRFAILGLITSSLLGVVVGLVPANRAAGLDPIRCLRAE